MKQNEIFIYVYAVKSAPTGISKIRILLISDRYAFNTFLTLDKNIPHGMDHLFCAITLITCQKFILHVQDGELKAESA